MNEGQDARGQGSPDGHTVCGAWRCYRLGGRFVTPFASQDSSGWGGY